MKFLKLSFTLLLLVCANLLPAQEQKTKTGTDSLSNPYTIRYTKLKELYIKMLDSDSNKKADALLKAYLKKSNYLNYKDEIKALKDYGKINEWVEANISKTAFKNREEAVADWVAITTAHSMVILNNKEYSDYLIETVTKSEYGSGIFADVVKEVMYEHPEKMSLPQKLVDYIKNN